MKKTKYSLFKVEDFESQFQGDSEIIKYLIFAFEVSVPQDLEAIDLAISSFDSGKALFLVHKLRGTIQIFQCPQIEIELEELQDSLDKNELEYASKQFVSIKLNIAKLLRELLDFAAKREVA